MKTNISTPVFIGIIVVVALALGAFVWVRANRTTSSAEVANIASTINTNKPSTEAVSKEQASGDAMLMGGKKK